MGSDGWAFFSQDGSLTAHFEHTVAITAEGPRILTPWHLVDEGQEQHVAATLSGRR
jgi:methionyl aminopeptidase